MTSLFHVYIRPDEYSEKWQMKISTDNISLYSNLEKAPSLAGVNAGFFALSREELFTGSFKFNVDNINISETGFHERMWAFRAAAVIEIDGTIVKVQNVFEGEFKEINNQYFTEREFQTFISQQLTIAVDSAITALRNDVLGKVENHPSILAETTMDSPVGKGFFIETFLKKIGKYTVVTAGCIAAVLAGVIVASIVRPANVPVKVTANTNSVEDVRLMPVQNKDERTAISEKVQRSDLAAFMSDDSQKNQQVELVKQTLNSMGLDTSHTAETGCLAN